MNEHSEFLKIHNRLDDLENDCTFGEKIYFPQIEETPIAKALRRRKPDGIKYKIIKIELLQKPKDHEELLSKNLDSLRLKELDLGIQKTKLATIRLGVLSSELAVVEPKESRQPRGLVKEYNELKARLEEYERLFKQIDKNVALLIIKLTVAFSIALIFVAYFI